MKTLKVQAFGKINWAIDVLFKRPDGYHEVDMLLQSVSLYDEIELMAQKAGHLSLCVLNAKIPGDEKNLAYAAAALLQKEFPQIGAAIKLKKNIPVGAGMAGGSADAAGVLYGLNQLFDLRLSLEDLKLRGLTLGADIPFCLEGGCMRARGIGEVLTPMPAKPQAILVIKPAFSISTPLIYKSLQLEELTGHPDLTLLCEALQTGSKLLIAKQLYNALEIPAIKLFPKVSDFKTLLLQEGAIGALMSGSGSAVFGLYDDYQKAVKVQNKLRRRKIRCYALQTQDFSLNCLD